MSETIENAAVSTAADGKIVCHIDNVRVHSVQSHIKANHADTWTIERYKEEFPDAPILSEKAKEMLAKRQAEKADEATAKANLVLAATGDGTEKAHALTANMAVFHEIFELGNVPAALSAKGGPISVTVMSGHDQRALDYLPAIDRAFVFSIDLLKKVIVGFQLNMPVYLWGLHGTGKTTLLEQACARTKRPFVRVQHTINMQESDVLGQWIVRDGATQFQLGPLPMAMINGWVYCADEYDFAMPSVTAVYQPVLEGKALIIKDAPPVFRRIEPHPDFRFCATGNTNGVGDETGLYQGTIIQNAANYSRFGITEEVTYMDPKIEANVLSARTGLHSQEAQKLVKFANQIRDEFRSGKIGMVISPRELINAAQLSCAYGGKHAEGLRLAFANRLSRVDKEVVGQLMQRMFG